MTSRYTPTDWYWQGEPGIYGSARTSLVPSPTTDADYQAWLASGSRPTPWPADATGAVTAAALDNVLTAVGLPPTGLTTPTPAQLRAHAGATADGLVAALRAIPADGVTVRTDSGDATIALLNAIAATLIDGAATIWTATDLSTVTVTGPQLSAAASAALAYRISVYGAALPAVLAAIAGGTIATFAAIDSYSWPE